MAKITKKVRERLRAGVRRFKPLLKAAKAVYRQITE